VAVCANCGHENPEGARFCNSCAAPLAEAPAAREQRKTVTEADVLDLAGLRGEAAGALRDAIELWELKGASAEVRLAEQRLTALEART
jgi:predicted amidophosphoribosyltransferase